MRRLIFIFVVFPSWAATCPAGFIAVEDETVVAAVGGACPAGYVAHDAGACRDGVVCYADLVSGNADGAINVRYNNAVYHTEK